MASNNRLLVMSIDIGTTFSGYAFSFTHEFKEDKLKIRTNKIWTDDTEERVSYKCPTVLLFNPELEFDSFGYEAETKYAKIARENQHRDWYCFKKFKMSLYEEEHVNRDLSIPSQDGKKLPAITVVSQAIRFMKDHFLTLINETKDCTGTKVGIDDVQFVLTVPAIWSDAAKQFMRECGVKAGLPEGQITIALEPEAASIYCETLPADKLCSEMSADDIPDLKAPGMRYIVVDAGGGTVDTTVHEVQAGGRLKEIHQASGGGWGGTNVDDEFTDFLTNVFTVKVMREFGKNHRADWLEMERDFEFQKRRVSTAKEDQFTFKIPGNLFGLFNVSSDESIEELVTKSGYGKLVTILGDKLRIRGEVMQRMFQPTIDKIIDHVRTLTHDPKCHGVSAILMVGGLSESPFFNTRMREAFRTMKVITPEDAVLSILKGGVIFGHVPETVSVRMSAYTYGVKITSNFIPEIYDRAHMRVVNGQELCENIFEKYITINEEVEFGQKSPEKIYHPISQSQNEVMLPVYRSTEPWPIYTTEPTCRYVGNLHVPLPDTDTDKKVKICFVFGGTELTVQARAAIGGREYNASFNFLVN